jgi:hypothetical protein
VSDSEESFEVVVDAPDEVPNTGRGAEIDVDDTNGQAKENPIEKLQALVNDHFYTHGNAAEDSSPQSSPRKRRMFTAEDSKEDDEAGKNRMIYKTHADAVEDDCLSTSSKADKADSKDEQKQCVWDTEVNLDVDRMIRQEIAWLKRDGYLAGQASFFKVCCQLICIESLIKRLLLD